MKKHSSPHNQPAATCWRFLVWQDMINYTEFIVCWPLFMFVFRVSKAVWHDEGHCCSIRAVKSVFWCKSKRMGFRGIITFISFISFADLSFDNETKQIKGALQCVSNAFSLSWGTHKRQIFNPIFFFPLYGPSSKNTASALYNSHDATQECL